MNLIIVESRFESFWILSRNPCERFEAIWAHRIFLNSIVRLPSPLASPISHFPRFMTLLVKNHVTSLVFLWPVWVFVRAIFRSFCWLVSHCYFLFIPNHRNPTARDCGRDLSYSYNLPSFLHTRWLGSGSGLILVLPLILIQLSSFDSFSFSKSFFVRKSTSLYCNIED